MNSPRPHPRPAPPTPEDSSDLAPMPGVPRAHTNGSDQVDLTDVNETDPPVALSDSMQALLVTDVTENPVAVVPVPTVRYAPENGWDSPEGRPPCFTDFHLLGKLGEGAMGTVYKARQLSTDRDMALKVLFPHMARNPKLLERFYREARMMGQFDHPNIVCGYAVGEEYGRHYFAMEFVDGPSLHRWLALLGKMSVGDALHVILACAQALQYVHDLNLVHRDIKPDNVLITPTGVIKVTDLGVAKVLDEEMALTQTGNSVGTPYYMPPEQARNAKETDARSDIYALGCMLYCTLTGQPPFNGANLLELLQAKEAGKFLPARRLNPEVPERLDLIIDKMVAKDVRYRYQTCAEVIKDLESLGSTSPVLTFLPEEARKRTLEGREEKKRTVLGHSGDTPLEVPVANHWYVNYRQPDGETVTRRMTTTQVLELINDEDFDFMTKIARNRQDDFRALASYREFESVFLARVAKPAADQRTSGFRSLYKKLDEEDRQRQQESFRSSFQRAAFTWPILLYWIASRGLALLLFYLVLRLLIAGVLKLF